MKESETLLLEKETKVEKKIEEKHKKINLASISSQVEREPAPTKNIVIETPNYDLIPSLPPEKEKRVLKLERQVEEAKPKKKNKFLRKAIFASIIAIVVGLGVFTTVDLVGSASAYQAAQSTYSVNLANLLKNIASVDSGNKTAELIETFPSELLRPDELKKESNWFDRICNFLSGLFGG